MIICFQVEYYLQANHDVKQVYNIFNRISLVFEKNIKL